MFLQVDKGQVKKKFSRIPVGNGSQNGRLDSQVDCQATIEKVLVSEIENWKCVNELLIICSSTTFKEFNSI